MDEIASQLGISKKTIYQYFADKHELVDAVAEAHIMMNKDRCEMDKLKADNAIHEIFLALDMIQEMMAEMSPTIFYDLEKFHPKTFTKFNEHRYKYLYQVIKKNLEWGIADGHFRSDLDVDMITKMRLEMMFLPFNQMVYPQNKYSLIQVEKELLEHYLYGIANSKSHKTIEKYKKQRYKGVTNDEAK